MSENFPGDHMAEVVYGRVLAYRPEATGKGRKDARVYLSGLRLIAGCHKCPLSEGRA
jgi:hypothetical protein